MRSIASFILACCWMYFIVPGRVVAQSEVSQPKKIESRHFYMKDGLPDEGVTAVVQDNLGFLWMATFSGLTKFDGYNFTTFQNNPFSSNSLGNNSISTLWQDKNGRLWIGHDEGLDLFDPVTENFFYHWDDSLNVKKELNIKVNKIRERKDGMVWICTNQGVYLADPETLIILGQHNFPSDLIYTDITEGADSSVWVGSRTGLIHVDSKTGKIKIFKHDPADSGSLSNDIVKTVFTDKSGRLWVGTARGSNLYNSRDGSFSRYVEHLDVVTFYEDTDGTFWTGTQYGVYNFDRTSGKSERITDPYYIFSIFKDIQGIFWLATYHGLHQINPENKKFNTYLQFNNNIGHLVEDGNHQIWMSTFRGLFRFDHSFMNIYQHRKILPDHSNMVRSIYADNNESVWFASAGEIEKFNLQNETSINISLPPTTSPINTMLVDSKGKIWLGYYHDHIGKYDHDTQTYEPMESLPKTATHHFFEDLKQNIWIGTSSGLVRYDLKSGKINIFKNDPRDSKSLSNNIVYNILMDIDGTMWIATDGGLNKMIPGTENTSPKFIHWRTSNSGLPNNNVYSILDGFDGTLWMACGNMISHFYPQQNIFRNYDAQDGLPGRDIKEGFFHGRGLSSSNGEIYFGTGHGVVVFHPDSLQDNPFVPPLAITGLSVHNQPAPLKGTDADTLEWKTPLDKSISHTTKIVLEYFQNDFNFEFSSLNFVNPENNLYKYKLEPYETEWIITKASSRIARYTNINPGTYTFRVIGSNNDGIWNEEGTTLMITITPPWWQTWWAYTLYGVAFIGLILSWRQYDIKRVKLKHRAEHLSELDNLKTRFFANISHEFRTPITLILGPLKEMYQGKFKGDQTSTMGIMLRNAQRLLALINQLLDLSKIEAGKLKLHTSPTDLVEFLREIVSSYESLAADKKIKYFFYPEVEILIGYIDAEKMEKVVHNILSNAFKFTKSGSEIILYLKVDTNQAQITVKDTGIGIPSDQLNKVFDRFYQVDSSQTRAYEGSGLGMALAKELVELHKGKISVSSIEGKGTTFTVTIPLGKEHLNKDEISDSGYHIQAEKLSDIVVSAGPDSGVEEPASSTLQPVLLIVEDNADMRRYIRKTLTDHYQVIEAENGKAGVKLAEETVPDLIISDIMMPEMDGYKLCELIKTNELTSHIPVILLTAKADRESKLAGLQFGADDNLSKPFDADELKLIVRNRIEERRKMRERFSKEITLEPKQISINSLDEKFLTKVLAIIEEHMDDENFSIEELSREAGFSNMHFYRKIKALSGQTPSQFLRTIRLKRAAELLAKNSDNVTQIAYSVGFSSLSYFNKCFKEQFGVTPGQYAVEAQK